MHAFRGAQAAAAMLTLSAGATVALAQGDLDDLEVTMEVVDDVVELEAAMSGLRRPGERGDFSADIDDAEDPEAELRRLEAEPLAPSERGDEGRDAFADDGLGEMNDADFEAQDDFEEGEDVDLDQFDELPDPMPDPVP